MSTKLVSRPFRTAAILMLLTVSGCAANSPPSPPVIAKQPEATPLPVSVSRIDPQSSQTWLQKVETYLRKVDELSKAETPK